MDCADCALRIENKVSILQGIKSVKVNFMKSILRIEFDSDVFDISKVKEIVESTGYQIEEQPNVKIDTLYVKGMDCSDEAIPIERRLQSIPGVKDFKFNLVSNKLTIEHNIKLEDIQQALLGIGFESHLAKDTEIKDQQSFWQEHKMTVLTVLSGIFAASGLLTHYTLLPKLLSVSLLLIAIFLGGFHIAKKGIKEIRNLSLSMNFLMTIAVIGAIILGELTEAAVVIFLFALAQLLESYSIERVRRSIESLMELAPSVALIKTASGGKRVAVQDVNIGDIIIIRPGDRIPLDGVVKNGYSMVNQSTITGESTPMEKRQGNEVYAGTINQDGMLEIEVTKRAEDSTIARIVQLVEEAQTQKAPTQQIVEKFARYYTPIVVSFAILLAIIPPVFFGAELSQWIYRALVLLVISCPCALVISTPVTIISALTNATRQGILIKGGADLENFNKMKVFAFDKTGTLTYGKPTVQSIISLNGYSKEELLRIAASIEFHSEHSIGKAIVEYAQSMGIDFYPVESFQSLTGKGAKANINHNIYYIGNHRLFEELGWCEENVHEKLKYVEDLRHTAVLLGNDKNILGIIAIADDERENAVFALRELFNEGVQKSIMLTGDNKITAEAIAQKIDVDEFIAELLPEDKVNIINELKDHYKYVAMVGDGINDAPALAAATMGIAMGASGSDTALETADIALLNDDLTKLAYLKRLSHKTIRIVKENIFIALFLKGIFFLLALPGWATLWMAVFADMGASLIVIFNGLRMLYMKRKGI